MRREQRRPVAWHAWLVVLLLGGEAALLGVVTLVAATPQATTSITLTYPEGTGSHIVDFSQGFPGGTRNLSLQVLNVSFCDCGPFACVGKSCPSYMGSVASCLDAACQKLGSLDAKWTIITPYPLSVGPGTTSLSFLVTITNTSSHPVMLQVQSTWHGITMVGTIGAGVAAAGAGSVLVSWVLWRRETGT